MSEQQPARDDSACCLSRTRECGTFDGSQSDADTIRIPDLYRRIYSVLARVPRGRVISYGSLARAAGCRSPRAVGRALRKNPFAPHVPCHRVIAADGTPGGFHGRREGPEIKAKLAMLSSEGVSFHNGRLADKQRYYQFAATGCNGDSHG